MLAVDPPKQAPLILELVTRLHEAAPHFDDMGGVFKTICSIAGVQQGALAEVDRFTDTQGLEYELLAFSGFESKQDALNRVHQLVPIKTPIDDGVLPSDVKGFVKGDTVYGFIYLSGVSETSWSILRPIMSCLTMGLFQRASDRRHLEELEVFREAFEATAEGYVIYDPEDRLHYCNSAYKDFYSRSREMMLPGVKFRDILKFGLVNDQYAEAGTTPEEHDAWLKARLMLHKRPMHAVSQQLSDGRWLKINERCTERGFTVGVRTDVTEFKETEEALRKSEAEAKRLALVASNTNNHVKILDATGNVEWVNESFLKATGYTFDEAVERPFGTLLAGPGTDAGTKAYFDTCIANGEACKEVIHSYKKDGTPFWNLVEIQPIFDEGGRLSGFIVIGQDVTKEKTAELAIKRSEMKFRSLVDLAPVGILQTSMDGRFVECNKTFCQLSMMEKPELSRSNFGNIFSTFSDEDREDFIDDIKTHGHVGPVEIDFTSGGETQSAIINSLLIDIPGGMPIVWTIAQDITEHKRVERLKSEFISIVSHELRTPITAMIGSLGLVSNRAFGALSDKQATLLDMAHKNAVRLKTMVNDILDSEKMESSEFSVELGQVDLVSLIRQTVTDFSSYATEAGVELVVQTELEQALSECDGQRVSQMLLNLLSNAVKYSPKGEAVRLELRQGDNGYELTVTDNGPGIAPEVHEKLFERFYQADSTDKRAQQGTGLGLSICQALARAHGTKIAVDSEPGKGAAFSFCLNAA